jgi:hypothetical protein
MTACYEILPTEKVESGTPMKCQFMNVRDSLPLALLVVASLATSVQTHAAPPNIVLCMADDQGWGDTAYNGHPC